MAGSWSNTYQTSLTLPTGAVSGARIVLDGLSDVILVYDAADDLIVSIAGSAGVDPYGNAYPQGISVNQGVISGVTIQSNNFSNDPVTGITGWQLADDGTVYMQSTVIGNNNYQIDQQGNASFQSVTVNDTLSVGGLTLDQILSAYPKGITYWGSRNTDSDETSGTTELAVLTVGTTFEDQRMYEIGTSTMRIVGTTADDSFIMRVRDGGSSAPTTSSDQLFSVSSHIDVAAGTTENTIGGSIIVTCDDSTATSFTNFHSGDHNLLMTLARANGTGTAHLYESSATVNPIELYLKDLGSLVPDTGVPESGGGGSTPVTPFTFTYTADWDGTYTGSGTYRNPGTDPAVHGLYQGFYSPNNGNQKALVGFDYSQIQSDLAGATITKFEVYLYYSHWYFNNGGTAVVGYHNLSNSSHPASYPGSGITAGGWTFPNWQINQGQWVELGIAVGQGFQAGTIKGIAIGPGPTTSNLYYGYCDSLLQSHPVRIRFTGTH